MKTTEILALHVPDVLTKEQGFDWADDVDPTATGYIYLGDRNTMIHAWWDDNVLHLDVTDKWLVPYYTMTFTEHTPRMVFEAAVRNAKELLQS